MTTTAAHAPDSLASLRDRATIPLWPDAARIIGVGKSAIYQAAAEGTIPTVRIGRRILVPVPRLLAWLGEPTEDKTS